jgi:hypothetical protein
MFEALNALAIMTAYTLGAVASPDPSGEQELAPRPRVVRRGTRLQHRRSRGEEA